MIHRYTTITLVLAACLSCSSCNRKSAASTPRAIPVQVIDWVAPGGFGEWGQTDTGFLATSVKPELLEVWKWEGGTLRKSISTEVAPLLDPLVLPDGRYLACRSAGDGRHWPLVIGSPDSKEVAKQWVAPAGWYYTGTGISRNGKFVCVTLQEDMGNPPPDANRRPGRGRLRVGVMDLSSMEMRQVAQVTSRGGNNIVNYMTISDDGKYVAVGDWDNGAVLVDAVSEKVLWNKKPDRTVEPSFVVFSADASKLYVGDSTQGCVFVLETLTGDVVSQWFCTETGKDIYGHRVSCMAVSADDSWIAAGTGPEGQVYLINAKSPEKPVILPHNRGTVLIVSFSPDSKRLASVAGGQIKIWDVPPGASSAGAGGRIRMPELSELESSTVGSTGSALVTQER